MYVGMTLFAQVMEFVPWTSFARIAAIQAAKRTADLIPLCHPLPITRVAVEFESMNGQLQHAKRAARGYRTAKNFIAIAYLRLSRLKNLPAHPFAAATVVR